MINSLNQYSGVSGIMIFANRMFSQMEKQSGGDFPITPLAGTYILGVGSVFGCFFGIILLAHMGRKSIFILGQLTMGFCHIMVATCLVNEWQLTSFVFIILFIFCFQISQGNVAWIYSAEVSVDAASGFTISAQFLAMLTVTGTLEYMMNGPLQVYGTFYLFGVVCLLGTFFFIFFVKETKGLTDIEKKTLYTP